MIYRFIAGSVVVSLACGAAVLVAVGLLAGGVDAAARRIMGGSK